MPINYEALKERIVYLLDQYTLEEILDMQEIDHGDVLMELHLASVLDVFEVWYGLWRRQATPRAKAMFCFKAAIWEVKKKKQNTH